MSSISHGASHETGAACTLHVRQPALPRRRPVRVALITAALVAGVLVLARAGQAYEGPWCALSDIGGGVMQENCSMRSLEMCRQEVIAGNRGFCNPNPRWQGNPTGVRQSPARRKRPAY